MSLRRALWIGVAVLTSAGLAGAVAQRRLGEAPPAEPIEVQVTRGDIRQVLTTTGRIRPVLTVDVGSQISGQILAVDVDYNSVVSAHDVIARIDPVSYEARVAQAEAALAAAAASIAVQEAMIVRARAVLARSERQSRRASALRSSANVAEQAWEGAMADAEIAAADLRTALAQRDAALPRLRQLEAEVSSARIDLARTLIRAPISGTVIERRATQGQTVVAALSSPVLFRIAETLDEVAIDAQIDEADIGALAVGNAVEFTSAADAALRRTGLVRQIRLAPNEGQVVTYTAVIAAENGARRLLPGMTANVTITTGERRGVLLIPTAVLSFRPPGPAPVLAGAGALVWLADGRRGIAPRRVTLGLIAESQAEVTEGLAEGDRVVTGMKAPR